MADIEFFTEDHSFQIPKPRKTRQWIRNVIAKERKTLIHVNYIFCSDAYLLSLNQEYLRHKTLTDIITFGHSDRAREIEGDIFISIDRVAENARKLGTSFEDELHRVIVHGVLHLAGYRDKSRAEKLQMRKKEDAYLSLRDQD